MTCERYKDALIDAAAGEPLDPVLADHVEGCTPCRATLTHEQDLFAAIDDALRARMSERPQAGFLAGVHAQIAHEAQEQDAQKQSGLNPMWALAGAAALALVVVVIAHPWGRLQQPPVTVENVKAPALRAHESPAMTQSGRGSTEHSGTQQHARLDSAQPLYSAQIPIAKQPVPLEPEVLVPPDEAKALALFVARVAGRDERAQAVVRPASDKATAGSAGTSEFLTLDMADLQREPLQWEAWTDEGRDPE